MARPQSNSQSSWSYPTPVDSQFSEDYTHYIAKPKSTCEGWCLYYYLNWTYKSHAKANPIRYLKLGGTWMHNVQPVAGKSHKSQPRGFRKHGWKYRHSCNITAPLFGNIEGGLAIPVLENVGHFSTAFELTRLQLPNVIKNNATVENAGNRKCCRETMTGRIINKHGVEGK